MLQYFAVCCSVLPLVAVCCTMLLSLVEGLHVGLYVYVYICIYVYMYINYICIQYFGSEAVDVSVKDDMSLV